MQISVEISKYPLHDDYVPFIKDFIARLQQQSELNVVCNTMSTQVFGDYDVVMEQLQINIKRSFEQYGKVVFVCKFIHGDLSPKC